MSATVYHIRQRNRREFRTSSSGFVYGGRKAPAVTLCGAEPASHDAALRWSKRHGLTGVKSWTAADGSEFIPCSDCIQQAATQNTRQTEGGA